MREGSFLCVIYAVICVSSLYDDDDDYLLLFMMNERNEIDSYQQLYI